VNRKFVIASATLLFAAVGCGESANTAQPQLSTAAAKGAPGGGGGTVQPPPTTPPATPPTTPVPAPSGGTQIPPSPQTDGPAWFFSEIGGVAGPRTADIDFDAIQNQTAGAISVGASRFALELVYNVSKKTSLTITNVTFLGANPNDFAIAPTDMAALATTVIPANKGQAAMLHVSFTPTAEGPRTATMQVTSAAGVAQVFLKGTGLPQRPILAPMDPLNFLPGSAPANLAIQNTGGETLVLNSVTIAGPNASSFTFSVANNGFSNCFPGILLAPKSICRMAVGIAPGATGPANAALLFSTNDPVNPVITAQLILSP
jgi:hypothetical protein